MTKTDANMTNTDANTAKQELELMEAFVLLDSDFCLCLNGMETAESAASTTSLFFGI